MESKEFGGGTDVGYNRMNFRWGNVGTFQISPGSHMWQVFTEHYKDEEIPITMNFGVPPACTMLAGAAFALIDVTANSMPVAMPVTKLTFLYPKIIGMFLCHRADE